VSVRERRNWWPVVIGVAATALFLLERRRPLRKRVDPAPLRVPRNVTIGALGAIATSAAQDAIVEPVQRFAERRRLGLVRRLRLPQPLASIAGFLLLDYTLFLWHRLNHHVQALWRFHAAHHVDLDLDSTTGLRFHFGELALSAGLRAAQIVLIGADRETSRAYHQLLFASVLFHHSNISLSPRAERVLGVVLVTPRMHGIHHSTEPGETNANYSSLLSAWDRLHGTARTDVPQSAITIGVEGFEDPADVTLLPSLTLPFRSDERLRLDRPAGDERVAHVRARTA
jgi:sterol desaturase/sphingolipid hydroxylase (fatty acid hydroxylase superfamily)